MRRLRLPVACSALLLVACAHAAATSAGQSAAAALRTDELARSVIAEVEEVRGLKATSPIRVELLDPERFAAKLRDKKLGELPSATALEAVWTAFGFTGPGADAGKTVQGVVDEQVAGFYSPRDQALYVRTGVSLEHPPGVGPELMLRGVLAHEVEHALQDQVFHAFAGGSPDDEDAALARLALTEGDAQLAMLAVIARERGISLKQGLENFATVMRAMSPEGLIRLSGHSGSLLAAPRLLRDALLFPYFDGLELVGSAYLAGGFALVDRLFLHPPATTAQVLHPQFYSAGMQTVPVPVPAVPPGWRPVADGSMGELGARALLALCLPLPDARQRASGVYGDHFAIAVRPDGKLGLVWQAAFYAPQAAAAFAKALRTHQTCWEKVRGDGPGSVGLPVQVVARGKTVLLARGVAPEEAAALEGVWSKPLPRAPRPKPPFGRVVLTPIPSAHPTAQVGRLEGGRYVDPGLALSAEIPAGFTPTVGARGVALSLTRTDGKRGGGFFSYIPSQVSDDLRRQTFAGFIGGMNASLGGGRHVEEEGGETAVALPLGQGFEQRWKVSDSALEVRAAILPACGGRAAYLLGTVSADEGTGAMLGRWLTSFQVDANAKAPVCDALGAALGAAVAPAPPK